MKKLLFLPLLYFIALFCQKQTDSFSLSKVAHFSGNPMEKAPDMKTYRYLTKGGQCYVFVSEDGSEVLKLFRASRLRLMQDLKIPGNIEKEEKKLVELLSSLKIAWEALRDETGLIYFHPGGEGVQPFKIIDKLGSPHTINPVNTPFVLQIRATPLKKAVETWKKEGETEKIKEGLLSLKALLEERKAKGIADEDANLVKNFAFIEQKAVQIDLGRFSYSNEEFPLRGLGDLRHLVGDDDAF